MAKKVKQVEAFSCDPDFCPRCGSILPLPGLTDVVSCSLCNFQKDTAGKSFRSPATNWENISFIIMHPRLEYTVANNYIVPCGM